MEMTDAIAYVRRDIGDPPEAFITNALNDGLTMLYDLPQQNVNPVGLSITLVNGSITSTLLPTIVPGTATVENPSGQPNFPTWKSSTAYQVGNTVSFTPVNGPLQYYQCTTANTNLEPDLNAPDWAGPLTVYTLDSVNGILLFNNVLPLNSTLVVTGTAWGMFTDNDLTDIVGYAVREHCMGQTITERFRDRNGFITYRDTPKDLDNLPKMEEHLVVTLADIEAMWVLATDAATDVNVQTAEGTNIDRSARYAQLMQHVQALRERYEMWCGQLGVGMFRIESLEMRRVSKTNNRLVPIFRPREYDDHRYPVRELPQVDRRDEDTSGVPSPIWNGLPI